MTDRADVLIIGAGPSGGVASLRLAEAGLDVVCLEQGEWPDPAAYRGTEDDWELALGGAWSPCPDVRKAPADYPIDNSDSDIAVVNFNAVGGGMIIFGGVWPRLVPCDFRTAIDVRLRRRLAADLRRAPAVLRADRPPVRCVGAGGEPGLPAGRGLPAPAHAHRPRGSPHCARTRPARVALVARRERGALARPMQAGGPASSAARATTGATRGRRRRPTSRTSPRPSPGAPAW